MYTTLLPWHRERQVFKKSKEEIKKIATDGAELLKKLAEETSGNFTFEYSPESFQGTEVDYALEVCNAVLDIWKPTKDNKAIINLPTTVEKCNASCICKPGRVFQQTSARQRKCDSFPSPA